MNVPDVTPEATTASGHQASESKDSRPSESLSSNLVSLPTWEECAKAVDGGFATHLQAFIYHNEPSDTGIEGFQTEKEFRTQLANLLAFERQSSGETTPPLAERLNAEIDRLDWDSTAADAVGADECVRFDDAVIKILKRIRGDKPPECSTDPSNCHENEGRGCACSSPKTSAEPACSKCKTLLAFEGDVCWACSKEER